MFSLFVEHNIEGAQALYDRVSDTSPARALSILSRMSEFVLPKLQRTEVTLPPEILNLGTEVISNGRMGAAAYKALRTLDPRAPFPTLTFAASVVAEQSILAAPEPAPESTPEPLDLAVLAEHGEPSEPALEVPAQTAKEIEHARIMKQWETNGE